MDLFESQVDGPLEQLCSALEALPIPERVDVLNRVRRRLHAVSPFRDEPVDCVEWVSADEVAGNEYNPNQVAPPEMRLLRHSIAQDGYTQPIVAWREADVCTVVDGFHRHRVGKEAPEVRKRIHGYLPVALIKPERSGIKDRMAATIRHNRARGVHGVVPMVDVVAALIRHGWADDEIAKELGMDADEILRFKQSAGLPELFKDHAYSRAWE